MTDFFSDTHYQVQNNETKEWEDRVTIWNDLDFDSKIEELQREHRLSKVIATAYVKLENAIEEIYPSHSGCFAVVRITNDAMEKIGLNFPNIQSARELILIASAWHKIQNGVKMPSQYVNIPDLDDNDNIDMILLARWASLDGRYWIKLFKVPSDDDGIQNFEFRSNGHGWGKFPKNELLNVEKKLKDLVSEIRSNTKGKIDMKYIDMLPYNYYRPAPKQPTKPVEITVKSQVEYPSDIYYGENINVCNISLW